MQISKNNRYFVPALEVIYTIILAVGVYKALLYFEGFTEKSQSEQIYLVTGGVLCLFVLVRFFFAPTKNVLLVTKKETNFPMGLGHKRFVLICDAPLLMAHAVVYYFLCSHVQKPIHFYITLAFLLLLNTFWLGWIWLRVKDGAPRHIKFWCLNNLIFGGLILAIILTSGDLLSSIDSIKKVVVVLSLFTLAALNCLLDLWNTWDAYLVKDN